MNERWIKWNGKLGERPEGDKLFDVLLRSGEVIEEQTNEEVHWDAWRHVWGDADIVGWKYSKI